MGGLKTENVEFLTMPWRGAYAYSRTESKRLGQYTELAYVTPVAGELLEIVNNKLSPFAETFSLSDLDIMSVNPDGSLRSTTGRVEDNKAAQPPEKPQEAPAEEPAEGIPEEPEKAPAEALAEEAPSAPEQPEEFPDPGSDPDFTIIDPPAAE